MSQWKTGSFTASPMARGDYRAPAQRGGPTTSRHGSAGRHLDDRLVSRAVQDYSPKGQWRWDNAQFWQDRDGLRTDDNLANRWTPEQLGATLKGWLRGDHLGGVDLSDVTSWTDASGGTNAVSAGNHPQLRTAAKNNLNIFQSTAANIDRLDWVNPSTLGLTEGFIIYVAKSLTALSTGLPTGKFGSAAGAEVYNAGNVLGDTQSGFLSTTLKTGISFGDPTAWHIGGFESSASNWKAWRDGATVFTTATNTVGAFSGASFVGAADGPQYADAQIAEIILCSAIPSVATRQRIEGYLAHRWDMTSVLDAGHPYKTNPPLVAADLTLTAQLATFSMTGQSAVLRAQRSLIASAAASYTLTGQNAEVRAQRRLTANLGTFSMTGQSAALRAQRLLTANLGTFSMTGQSAVLRAQRLLTVSAAASFVMTGQSAGLNTQRRLTAQLGTFSMTGLSVSLRAQRLLTAQLGTFSMTGLDVGLIKSRVLEALLGTYTLTGQNAVLRAQRRLTANLGTFTMTGLDAELRKVRILTALLATYTLTPNNVILGYTGGGSGPSVRVTAFFYRR